jgi:hypothetical protein
LAGVETCGLDFPLCWLVSESPSERGEMVVWLLLGGRGGLDPEPSKLPLNEEDREESFEVAEVETTAGSFGRWTDASGFSVCCCNWTSMALSISV